MKKRLLSFALALMMMVSLLSFMGPRTVYAAETYTVNFAMPNEYLEYFEYMQLLGHGAKSMSNTNKVITIDGTAYTIFSITTSYKPDTNTYFKVVIRDPNAAGNLAGSEWTCNVEWQYGENIVAVPLGWNTIMPVNKSTGTITFVNIAKTVTFDLKGGALTSEQVGIITGKGWSYDAESGYYTKQFVNSTAYSTIISDWNDCSPAKAGVTFDTWSPETGTLTENTTFTANYANTINVTEHPAQALKYNGQAQALGYVEADGVEGATIQYKVGASEYSADLPEATDAGNYMVGYKVEKTGYKTVEGSFSVFIGKGTPTLTLSSESGSYVIPNAGTFTYVYSGDGALSVSSDDLATATASINTTTKTVTVEPVSLGSATITIAAGETNNYSPVSATYAATIAEAYTVTFDAEDGSPEPEQQLVAYGGKIIKPADPTKQGYTFGGWYKEEACTTAWDFASETVTKDTTLYAKWTEDKAKPSASDFTFTAPSSLTYDKTAKAATVTGKEGMGTITVKYATSLTSEEWTLDPPKNANTYYVKACIAEGTEYAAAELTDAAWKFTIKPAKLQITLSQNSFVYNGEEQVPEITVKGVEGDNLKEGTDYQVTIGQAKSVDVGTYTVNAASFNKNYEAADTVTYTITQAAVPTTGDTTNMCLYILIAVLALGAMGAVTVTMRRKANR